MATISNANTTLAHLQDELDGVTLYRGLAELEKDAHLAELYRRLAAVEKRHAQTWAARLHAEGVDMPVYRPSWRTRVMLWLARRFGADFVLPTIAAREQSDAKKYRTEDGVEQMSSDEISHARLLGEVTKSLPGGLEGSTIAQLEGRHRAGGGNALRAAVLGANDGLVSNMSTGRGVFVSGMRQVLFGLAAAAITYAIGRLIGVSIAG